MITFSVITLLYCKRQITVRHLLDCSHLICVQKKQIGIVLKSLKLSFLHHFTQLLFLGLKIVQTIAPEIVQLERTQNDKKVRHSIV